MSKVITYDEFKKHQTRESFYLLIHDKSQCAFHLPSLCRATMWCWRRVSLVVRSLTRHSTVYDVSAFLDEVRSHPHQVD